MRKQESKRKPCCGTACRQGLTLIEVLLAVAILGVGIVMMLTAISRCLRVFDASTGYHDVMWTLSAGEVEYPMIHKANDDDMEPEDLAVSPEEFDGVVYERIVEDPYEGDEDSDVRLLVVKIRLTWPGRRGKEKAEEVTRYWLFRE